MNIKPLSNHVLIKPVEAETTTASGIIIPDTVSQDRSEKGEIIAIGPGKMLDNGQRQAMEVSVGQTVMFKKYAPDEITVDGQEYLVVKADDVIAIIE